MGCDGACFGAQRPRLAQRMISDEIPIVKHKRTRLQTDKLLWRPRRDKIVGSAPETRSTGTPGAEDKDNLDLREWTGVLDG
jgi:hypothetical protein